MRTWLAAATFALAVAGQTQAATLTCDEALARIDTFGRLRWTDRVEAVPSWAVDARCDEECAFSDPEGVRYEIDQGRMLDKELKGATAWPWGLKSDDGPDDARAKLVRLLPGELKISPDDPPIYYLNIKACMIWIEIAFDGERGIRSVSLNAQP